MNAPTPLEDLTEQTFDSLNQSAQECLQRCQDHIRDRPVCSVLTAVAAGYALRIFPVTLILGAFARCFLTLLRPALMIYGAVKLFTCLQGKRCRLAETEPLLDSPPGPPRE